MPFILSGRMRRPVRQLQKGSNKFIFELKKEVSEANLNVNKTILKCQLFLHGVHNTFKLLLPGFTVVFFYTLQRFFLRITIRAVFN